MQTYFSEDRIELRITPDMLEGLFKGKKITFTECITKDKTRTVTLYPHNHGIFLAHEDYMRLKNMAISRNMMWSDQEFFTKLEQNY